MKTKTKKGNTALITLIVVIVAITFAVIGYLFAKKAQAPAPVVAQPVATQPTTPDIQVQQAPVDNKSYIEVKELGFKIPVDSSMTNELTYIIVDGSSARFSSKSLNAASKFCGDGSSGPSITKISGTPLSQGGDLAFWKARMSYIKQYDGFFLMFNGPQDSCSMGKSVDLEQTVIRTVNDGFNNVSLISQDTDATANWQTYTNTEFGFQFDYLVSSGFDINKLKVEGWDCAEKERCVVLSLPTTDKDFAPSNWIPNPTKEDLAKPATYTVLYVHIADKNKYDTIIGKDCIKDKDVSFYCQPNKLHNGNKVYFSSNGKFVYAFDNSYGEKNVQMKSYPDDGITWSSLGNFKAL